MSENHNDVSQTNGEPSPPPSHPTRPDNPSISVPLVHRSLPATSLQDNGQDKRPRDARLIHMLLSSLGVTAYQERVPLQLLDFAYRHSSSILSDALHLSSDSYLSQQNRTHDTSSATGVREIDGRVSANAVQLAIQSRLQYQFSGSAGLSKEFLLETAQKRNAVALPRVLQNEWGVRLPSERFVLTGVPWSLRETWSNDALGAAVVGTESADLAAVDVEMVEEPGVEAEPEMFEEAFGDTMDEEEMED